MIDTDSFGWMRGGAGADTMTGGHHIFYDDSTAGVVINLSTQTASGGYAEGDKFSASFIAVRGSEYGDVLTASSVGDGWIEGQGGNDVIYGSALDNGLLSGGDGNDTLNGLGGNDAIYGGSGDDYLAGGAGNDTLNGNAGNDAYQFAKGDGQDTIIDNSAMAGNSDVLQLSNINQTNLWFKHIGNDLQISIMGTTNQITVKDWYVGGTSGADNRIERIKTADGLTMYHTDVELFVQAMSAFAPPAAATTSWVNGQTSNGKVLLTVTH